MAEVLFNRGDSGEKENRTEEIKDEDEWCTGRGWEGEEVVPSWLYTVTVKERVCSPDIELLAAGLRTYHWHSSSG